MSGYIKYELEDGSELLVELIGDGGGSSKAGISMVGEKAKASFDEALETVRLAALQIQKKFHEVQADEVEIKFGLKATGEVGNRFMVGTVGVEANYEVTLKWVNKKPGVPAPRPWLDRCRRPLRSTWPR